MLDLKKAAKVATIQAVSDHSKTVEKYLREIGFRFINRGDHLEGKLMKCDFLFVKIYEKKTEVYPIGTWSTWKHNSIKHADFIRRAKANDNIFLIILQNEKN